jgi:hypothetical protein
VAEPVAEEAPVEVVEAPAKPKVRKKKARRGSSGRGTVAEPVEEGRLSRPKPRPSPSACARRRSSRKLLRLRPLRSKPKPPAKPKRVRKKKVAEEAARLPKRRRAGSRSGLAEAEEKALFAVAGGSAPGNRSADPAMIKGPGGQQASRLFIAHYCKPFATGDKTFVAG